MAKKAQAKAAEVGKSTALLTVVLCYFIALFEGFDLQAAGVAGPKLTAALHLTNPQFGYFASASTFGLMFGAAIGGRLADWMGRKKVLLLAVSIFGVMSIMNGLAGDYSMLVTARFLTGLGLGATLPNILALSAENTNPSTRGLAIATLYAGMPSGGAIASLVSSVAPTWQTIFFTGGILPLLAVPVLFFILPDSREYKQAAEEGRRPGSIAEALVGNSRFGRTALLWIAFFLALVVMYNLLNWLPKLMVLSGLKPPQASLVMVSFNIFGATASVLTGVFMDRAPLTKVVFTSYLLCALALVVLWLAPVGLPLSLLVGGLVGATISMTQALLYAVAPQVYPVTVRGTGTGLAVTAGRFGATLGPLAVGMLMGAGAVPRDVLMLLVPVIVVSGLAAWALSAMIGGKAKLSVAAAAAH